MTDEIFKKFAHGLIVSCQALPNEPLHGSQIMASVAVAAQIGGAVGIRANTPADIAAIRAVVDLPIIGLYKEALPGFEDVYITPTISHAEAVAQAGANLIALDATSRPHPGLTPGAPRLSAAELIAAVRRVTGKPVLADISTYEEGIAAYQAGAEAISTTLSGYTPYSSQQPGPDFDLVRRLSADLPIPVIAEGRIITPQQARQAIETGAFAVVVGGAITRPQLITRRFAAEVRSATLSAERLPKTGAALAVDVGGTKIAVGLVTEDGQILEQDQCPTEPQRGPQDGLKRITAMLRGCLSRRPGLLLSGIGIGCTGPVDAASGKLGPNNFLVGWENVSLQERLSAEFGLPAATENDADAAALAETLWGAGRGAARCIYITVSTGIGGGLVIDGRLYRGVDGAHPEFGHHMIDPSAVPAGQSCFCGMTGCWESLASGPAMAAWFQAQGGGQADARQICALARQGDALARRSVEREGRYLGLGLANLITLFTPDVIVLGGGVMESWPMFEAAVRETIRTSCGLVPHEKTRLARASLGVQTGLAGAGAVWFQRRP